MTLSLTDAVREARTWEKAQAIAAELRKGGQYKAFINQAAPFSITKDNYDAQDRYIGETKYIIDLTALPRPTCTCPDFENHKNYCKHTMAIELALDEDAREVSEGFKQYEEAEALLEPFGYFAY